MADVNKIENANVITNANSPKTEANKANTQSQKNKYLFQSSVTNGNAAQSNSMRAANAAVIDGKEYTVKEIKANDGSTLIYYYNGNTKVMAERTDKNGKVSQYTYITSGKNKGKVAQEITDNGITNVYTYNDKGQKTKVVSTNNKGKSLTYNYEYKTSIDSRTGETVEKVLKNGVVESVKKTSKDGKSVATFTYKNGVISSGTRKNADGSVINYTYNKDGDLSTKKETSKDGKVTTTKYKYVLEEVLGGDSKAKVVYENDVRTKRIETLNDGTKSTLYYNENGNVVKQVITQKDGTTETFDEKALKDMKSDGAAKYSSVLKDAKGNVIGSREYAWSTSQSKPYSMVITKSAKGNTIEVTETNPKNGYTTTTKYPDVDDKADGKMMTQMIKVSPEGDKTTYKYNYKGQITKAQTLCANGDVINYTYKDGKKTGAARITAKQLKANYLTEEKDGFLEIVASKAKLDEVEILKK